MLTIDKSRDAVTSHFAWSRSVAWAALALGVSPFAGAWLAVEALVPEGYARPYAQTGLLAGLSVLVFIECGVAAFCNEGRVRRDQRLICPRCGGTLQLHGAVVNRYAKLPASRPACAGRAGHAILTSRRSDPGPPVQTLAGHRAVDTKQRIDRIADRDH